MSNHETLLTRFMTLRAPEALKEEHRAYVPALMKKSANCLLLP